MRTILIKCVAGFGFVVMVIVGICSLFSSIAEATDCQHQIASIATRVDIAPTMCGR